MIYSNDLYYCEFDPIMKVLRKHKIYAIRPIADINFHPMSHEYLKQYNWNQNYKQVLIYNDFFEFHWINVCNHQIQNFKVEIK